MACYGIDLGTTYSCIARINSANLPEIIPDIDSGNRTVASAVFFNADGSIVVGEEAKENGATEPERLCQFFKRYIGREDLQSADKEKLVYLNEGIDGQTHDPIELSSKVLQKLVDIAAKQGENVTDVVITCPAYFNNFQREATRKAGEDIGLHVINIVNEPTAAAAYYFEGRVTEQQTVLVYDLGGGTFDVSIIRMTPGKTPGDPALIQTLATNGDDLLGGKDWDDALYALAKKRIKQEFEEEIDDDSEVGKELRSDIEKYKIRLSATKGEAKVKTDIGNLVIKREEFDSDTASLLDRTFGFVDSALAEAGLTKDDLSKVLMVGGSTRMPAVQAALKDRFGEDRVIFNNPDEAVALGAAFICSLNWTGDFIGQFNRGDKTIRMAEDSEKPGTIEVVDTHTGEVDVEATKTANEKIEKGELRVEASTDNGDDGIGLNLVSATPAFKFTDGVPRTIGLVVLAPDQGENVHIADNVLIKGETAPKKSERDYYTSQDGQISIVIPVVESLSKADSDRVNQTGNNLKTLNITSDDPSIDLHQCENVLTLNFPKPMPKYSRLHVVFTIDDMGSMEITVEDTVNHQSNKIDFRYSKLS